MEKYFGNCELNGLNFRITALINSLKDPSTGEGTIISYSHEIEERKEMVKGQVPEKFVNNMIIEESGFSPELGNTYEVKGEMTQTPEKMHTFRKFTANLRCVNFEELTNKDCLRDDTPNATYVIISGFKIEDKSNKYYEMACDYARKGDKENALEYLKKAIAMDNEYRDDSKSEAHFLKLWDDPDFKKLVG